MRTRVEVDLLRPFPVGDIEWRVGARSKDRKKGQVLAYIDARHVMRRLDQVFGLFWQCEYVNDLKGPVVCRIGVPLSLLMGLPVEAIGDCDVIWRSDGAGETDIEGDKGKMSDAFKRAAVRWGVGRYLYQLPATWVGLENGYLPKGWVPPDVPDWATPEGFDMRAKIPKLIDSANAARTHFDSIKEIKRAFAEGDWDSAVEAYAEIPAEDQNALYRASKSGGIWTPAEYKAFHSNEFFAARDAMYTGKEGQAA